MRPLGKNSGYKIGMRVELFQSLKDIDSASPWMAGPAALGRGLGVEKVSPNGIEAQILEEKDDKVYFLT